MKKAIVIGASSGIGQEVARLLMEVGWSVGVAARREDRLLTLGATAYECIDVTSAEAGQGLRPRVFFGIIIHHAAGKNKSFVKSKSGSAVLPPPVVFPFAVNHADPHRKASAPD